MVACKYPASLYLQITVPYFINGIDSKLLNFE